jgi:hypothetical protein
MAREGQAQRGFFIPKGARSVDVPFEYTNNFIIITLRCQRLLPLRFIYDTGAEHTILTKNEVSRLLQIEYEREFQVLGSDLSTVLTAYLARGIQFEVTDRIVAPQEDILVLKEDYFRFEEYAGVTVHGILAGNVFARYFIKINYQRQVITLYERNSFRASDHKEFEAVPLEISRNKPYLNTHVRTIGDSLVPVRLLVDTGAGVPMILFENTHPLLAPPPTAIASNIGMGLGGYLDGYVGRTPALLLGALTPTQVLTYYQRLDTSASHTRHAARNGLIGNVLLSRCQVIIDYGAQQMWLKPTRNFGQQYVYDRSGLSIIASGPSLQQYVVQHVLPGSPGAEAGIQVGDVIVRVKRSPAILLSLPTLLKVLQGKPGKRVPLVLRRNGQRIRAVVVLRDLV